MDGMEKYLFVRPLLGLIAQPRFFCRLVSIALRACAALVVLFSLATFFHVGKLTFELPAQAIPGAVLFEIFFVLAIYAVVHVLLIRARDIDQLQAGEFFALPLAAVVTRLLGEAYAAFVSLVGIGGGVFVWFTGQAIAKVFNPLLRALFPALRDDPSFMGGIEFMVSGVLVGLAALIVAYAVSEALVLLARAANREVAQSRPASENGYRSRFGS